MSVFVKGDWGEEQYNRITGGVRVYLGADPKMTLIKRHRTQDPQNYTPVFPKLRTAGGGGLPKCTATTTRVAIDAPPDTPPTTPNPPDSEFNALAGCVCPNPWIVVARITRPPPPQFVLRWEGTCRL